MLFIKQKSPILFNMTKTLNNDIKSIVQRQRLDTLDRGVFNAVAREATQRLVDVLDSSLVKAILGPRRSGKSTLALLALRNKRFGYINLEDELIPSAIDGDELVAAIDAVYGDVDYYLFDEIQNLERWEQFINRIHRQRKNIIITGSNSKLLSDELASALTGRHIAIQLLPLSYKELSDAKELQPNLDFERYLVQGGFPDVVLHNENYRNYLRSLWDSVVLKDILKRYRVKNLAGLNGVLSLMIGSMGSRFSARSLERALNGLVSIASIQKFIYYARQAYLAFDLPCFSLKAKLRNKADRKAYLIDNGFYSAMRVGASKDWSKYLENLVFIELLRRGFEPGLDLFYYLTASGYEVDFLLRRGHTNIELVQVSWDLSSQKTLQREVRSLIQASKELNLKSLTVITRALEREISSDGLVIRVVPIEKWLTQDVGSNRIGPNY